MAEIITTEWFETYEQHTRCIGCDQPRQSNNKLFCDECYDAFRLSREYTTGPSNVIGPGKSEARWYPIWIAWANRRRKDLRLIAFCLCGQERPTDDYLCIECRMALNG